MANSNMNPNYLVTIQASNLSSSSGTTAANSVISIVAPMSAQFSFDSDSHYEAPYAQGPYGSTDVAQVLRLTGLKLSTQALTAQIWQGSGETSLGLELD